MQQVGRSAAEIAADVRAGTVSAEDVVREHLARIAALNGRLGAFQVVREARALAEAAEVDASPRRGSLPLAGVPVAVKDNVAVSGEPMRVGSAATSPAPRTGDHPVVRRLREAGAVVVGLTRVPELCIWPMTDGPHGTARNPWDLARTPGGSSGGSAAAVAAGLVPLAHANDGLGSIRIPAAACGLVGVRPGIGLVPAGLGADDWFGMAENGTLATTVADAALGLAVLAGDPSLAEVGPPPGRVRVALTTKAPAPGIRVRPEWVQAVREVAGVLRACGHEVVDAAPPLPVWAVRAALSRWLAGAGDDARALGLDPAALQRRTRTHIRLGRAATRLGWAKRSDTERWRAALAPFMARHDVILSPALAGPPPVAEPWATRGWPANYWASAVFTGAFQAPWNLAGWPSFVVPAGRPAGGTPLAVQLTAAHGGERLLLALARQLEQHRPWPRHADVAP